MRRLALVVLPAFMLVTAACSTAAPSEDPASVATSRSITVFAASSLKGTFTTMAAQYEVLHPGTTVTLNFGASSTLATQIAQGAPVDVFASASEKTMVAATAEARTVGAPQVFAVNTMEIATPTSPSVPVVSLADLANPELKVAVCQPEVPCGVAARALFSANALTVKPVTEEADVKGVMSKVELGEVDAGIVYVTDVKAAAGRVIGVEIPAAHNVTTRYPIVAFDTDQAKAAAEFVEYVRSPEGESVMSQAGFGSP